MVEQGIKAPKDVVLDAEYRGLVESTLTTIRNLTKVRSFTKDGLRVREGKFMGQITSYRITFNAKTNEGIFMVEFVYGVREYGMRYVLREKGPVIKDGHVFDYDEGYVYYVEERPDESEVAHPEFFKEALGVEMEELREVSQIIPQVIDSPKGCFERILSLPRLPFLE